MTALQWSSDVDVPRADAVLIVAVLASGLSAATLVNPWLWPATFAVVGVLLVASRRAVANALETFPYLSAFSFELRTHVTATLAELRDGPAARLLVAVARQASAIFAAGDAGNDERRDADLRASVAELVRSACTVAGNIAHLDVALSSDDQEFRNSGVFEAAAAARALDAKRLTDAESTLAALLASGLGHGSPESERIAELITEIRGDASARAAAWAEVNSLLRHEDAGA